MDFSQLNSAEQAHMSKVIEKKQVNANITSFPNNSQLTVSCSFSRCKISFACTQTSWKDASIHVVTTLQARLCLQKRLANHAAVFSITVNSYTVLLVGNLRYELHRQVFETFGAGRSKVRRAECRCVPLVLSSFCNLTVL